MARGRWLRSPPSPPCVYRMAGGGMHKEIASLLELSSCKARSSVLPAAPPASKARHAAEDEQNEKWQDVARCVSLSIASSKAGDA
jgi:hypothetical protein